MSEMEERGAEQRQGSGPVKKEKDLFDMEAGGTNSSYRNHQVEDWRTVLKLAFQCIGVVYGDLATSPLYVLPGVFQNGIKHNDDLLGVLSLIFYSVIVITLIKYVFIVMSANNNGGGGTFALYSLICRHVRVSLIPTQQSQDTEASIYNSDASTMASYLKSWLENSHIMKYVLLITTMLGVSMVLGDGILTPCISVLSAVGGLKLAVPGLEQDAIMWISVAILIVLFQIQRFGTHKVGYSFAPILALWLVLIAFIGVFNFFKHDPSTIKALNPIYIIQYFQRNKKDAWISLGGVILCLTGSEALFADLGHFNIRSIQLSSCVILVPSVLLAYLGQCSYLRKNSSHVPNAFYSSIPSQYYFLLYHKNVLVMVMIWNTNIIIIIIYILTVGLIELLYLSSSLYKFADGGYLPLCLAFVLVSVMFIWNYGYRKKYIYELENNIGVEKLTDIVSNTRIHRMDGLGLFYTPLVQGISPIFPRYVSSVPALHSVLVFVSIKFLHISKVPAEERFLFQRVKPGELIFRCVVRYGYADSRKDQEALFEEMFANQLREFIQEDNSNNGGEDMQREMALVDKALRDGIVYLMGEGEVVAANGSSWVKKFTIDYLYNWLSWTVKQPDEAFLIPRKQLLKVGMAYEV
ncbi:potassium transporter 5 [Jatropha curcas]|uniref:potassium transporter 5 n=1 Tax=Jatropha curcas TaxID=180498 RepID=UPI001894628B|nr:potassium transporter 5 [Jatropha curcas]